MELDPTKILSATTVIMILGLTNLVKRLVTRNGVDDTPEWLIAVPALLGLVAGTLVTISAADPATATDTMQWAASILQSALGHGGAAVLLYELYDRTLGATAKARKG